MFVSGPRLVRVCEADQQADGDEVGGGGSGVGLRGEAARRSGAASVFGGGSVGLRCCGSGEGCGDGPRLAPFRLVGAIPSGCGRLW